MNLNVMQYERQVYTIFDMLSDVGGLIGIMMSLLGFICAWWNYNQFDNFMVSRLFKIKKTVDEIKPGTEHFNKSEFIKLGQLPNFKEWFMSWIPKRCTFCKKSRHEIAM